MAFEYERGLAKQLREAKLYEISSRIEREADIIEMVKDNFDCPPLGFDKDFAQTFLVGKIASLKSLVKTGELALKGLKF